MPTILIIDDDIEVCTTMESFVTRMGMTCRTATSLGQGIEALHAEEIDVVILDVRLPDGDGLSALPRIKDAPSAPEVIVLTGKGDPNGAELAIQGGVWDYLVKPSPIKQTRLTLQRALAYRAEKMAKRGPVALNTDGVIGASPAMRKCFDIVATAASNNFSVLITGETGTGKELIARTIHGNSRRHDSKFVVVDCAALPEHLMESILFGHKRGAFTSAHQDRSGLIRQADGGTLFLDEIGELTPSTQRVFLRVLQERKFRPVGASREIPSDFRLIAATHRDLAAMVKSGRFREDLYYRLKAITVHLPPLRKRKEDIKALVMYYIGHLSECTRTSNKGVDADFMDILFGYDWPGNVRELLHTVEQAFASAGDKAKLFSMHLPQEIRIKVTRAMLEPREAGGEGGEVRPACPDGAIGAPLLTDPLPPIKVFKNRMEKAYLKHLIYKADGNLNAILETSGLSRSHFYALVKRHGIAF